MRMIAKSTVLLATATILLTSCKDSDDSDPGHETGGVKASGGAAGGPHHETGGVEATAGSAGSSGHEPAGGATGGAAHSAGAAGHWTGGAAGHGGDSGVAGSAGTSGSSGVAGSGGNAGSPGDLESWVLEQMDAGVVPGMAIALVDESGVMWSKGFGYADAEEGVPVTADTPFQVASISKTFIGVSLMQLVEAGAIALDDDVNTHLPFVVDNPNVTDETITLRHLANHTSSLLDDEEVVIGTYVPAGTEEPLGEFLADYFVAGRQYYDAALNFSAEQPGATYSYSNVAAALAAYALEHTTGVPFDQYTKAHIFEPLEMRNTSWHHSDLTTPAAVPYHVEDGRASPVAYYSYATYPDGALKTSANDLGRFLAAILNDGAFEDVRILDAASVDEMVRPQVPGIPPGQDVIEQGIFWEMIGEPCPGNCVGHSGGDLGVSTFMFYMPESRMGFLALANTDSEGSTGTMVTVIGRLLEELEAGSLY